MDWLRNAVGLCLILLLSLHAGQSAFADHDDETGEPTLISAQWQVLQDDSASLVLDDILQQQQSFKPLTRPSLAFPSSRQAVWLHTSTHGQQLPHWLWLFAPRVHDLDFYLMQDQRLIRQLHSGEAQPIHTRPLPSRAYLFTLPNDGESYDIYVRMTSSHPITAWFEIMDEAALVSQEKPAYIFGGLLGGLLLMALYNLIRFHYTRTPDNLWLSAMHLLLLACAAANLGILALWAPDLGHSQSTIADLASLGALFCLCGFGISFLRTPQTGHSRLNLLLYLPLALIAAILLANLLSQPFLYGGLLNLLSLGCPLLLLGIALYHWRKGYPPARLVVAGMLLFLLGFVGMLPSILGLTQLRPGWLVTGLFSIATLAGMFLSAAQSERHRHARQQRVARQTAEAASIAELRTKNEFLSNLSHEIRTPMNGVLGMTELLLGTPMSAKQRDYVQTIHSAGNELLSLINEILDFSRLTSSQIEFDDVQFDLNALLEDCLETYRSTAEAQKVELISFIQPQVPRVVNGDPARLRQILSSLLANAFKHTRDGEVLLVTALDNTEPPRLRFSVQSSSQSLSAEEQALILNTELNSRDLLSSTHLGNRLGLLIARQLIQLMRGDFGIQLSPKGTTFWLSLPIDQDSLERAATDQDHLLRGARLLVVDDNETCRKVLQQQCTAWGMQVSTAGSGREALALLRTKSHINEFFDVVLLDHDMPGMNGLQLAGKIKEDPNLQHDTLLIMLTGLSSSPGRIAAHNAGITRILAKPVAGYTLKATLAEELSRHAGHGHDSGTPQEHAIPDDFNVLVVEDNSISTKVIRGMLAKLNLRPDTAGNGEEALFAMQRNAYDLVLMDCEMPVLDGFAATERIRAWESLHHKPRTPIIALTAHILSEHQQRALEAGMDGHMSKPVELQQLREVLAHWAKVRARGDD